ncbi:DUF3667 domain-containing protein [Novosphingobium sp. 9U]|uniref:DUF3667 domain-containing protein n=1 Tax=Novosphingobium sp. 9U TaxID=2653158 RepID=UPI0012F21734|nr:DUF3667 domain-containing protein [Novosphingobium sp. 9U]VWX53007.1 conserved membrane hypothetical protein [Novosphingobium sp. 9U]
MSDIAQGLAEVGQGALAAHAVEPRTGEVDTGHTHEAVCLNCGTALVGSHCHSCGQAAHVHRTLGAFFHDLLHGVFHFEGKIWRTLPLLVRRPGVLTREYIDGRRAIYVSPIALFLFCVFLMFAVFHATEGENIPANIDLNNLDAAVTAQKAEIARLKQVLATREAQGGETDTLDQQIDDAEEKLDTLRDLQASGVRSTQDAKGNIDIPIVAQALKSFRENPALAAYKLQTYAYKYSWALIPISVPFLWLLFPFSRRFHLYDHTVFVTYSLCFMTLLAVAEMLIDAVGLGGVAGLLFFVPPFHMYAQLKGTYDLSRRGALWRTVLLVSFALMALLLFFSGLMATTGGE